jgi:hypothetical protein
MLKSKKNRKQALIRFSKLLLLFLLFFWDKLIKLEIIDIYKLRIFFCKIAKNLIMNCIDLFFRK